MKIRMNSLNSANIILTSIVFSVSFLSACGGSSSSAPTEPPSTPPVAVDSIAPLITLLGEASITIEAGTIFNDLGATAQDDIDGDISSKIVVNGSVNNNSPGEYVLTYNVSDNANNAATEIERTIIVSKVPILEVLINTQGQAIVDEPKVAASMQILNGGTSVYDGNIGIEIRGSSSQMFEKKSYGFETWDVQGEDLDVELAGFPEEEDWIFYAPYSDKSLLRNVLIYDLYNQIGRYAVKSQFAEMTINGDYRGTYVLMEKIKRDQNRVDISKLKSEDITGGYIIKIDKITGEDPTVDFSFSSKYDGFGDSEGRQKIKFLYEYPDPEDIETEEKQYIQNYYADFEESLMSPNFVEPQLGYRQYIDVPSFIDFFLFNELSHNVDGYRISTFMHKDKGEKLKMGPIWDFNIAFGNANYCQGQTTDEWAYLFNTYCPQDPSRVPFWWGRLLQDEQYVAELKARWSQLRGNELSNVNIEETIAKHVIQLQRAGAIVKNFERYDILGTYVWPNSFIGDTHQAELNYLRQWISQRLTWMDSTIDGL